MDKEAAEEYAEQHHAQRNIKELMAQQKEKEQSFREMILGQDQWQQKVLDGLLNIRRKLRKAEDQDGRVILQEFIKLKDGSGRWVQPAQLSKKELKELKSDGMCNEKGAKFIIGHLNGVDNNNIALSNMSQDKINKICREAENSLRNVLMNRREEFGIKDPSTVREIIASVVRPNMTANFSKAKNGQFVKELLRQTRMMGSLDEEDEDDNWLANFK